MKLVVVGQDPSLRHWGLARGIYDTETKELTDLKVAVIEPVLPKGKQVRQNSDDIEAAKQLYQKAFLACEGADAVFIEVPVGSQSARAMASYGVCVGIVGSLRAIGLPVYEVTAIEVKLAGSGKATASKADMIRWATKAHPHANWPTYTQKGKLLVTTSKAEHQADAAAAIYAGVATDTFQQLLPLLKRHKQPGNQHGNTP